MLQRIASLPLILLLMGVGALAMLVPATQAVVNGQFETARAFFYTMILTLILTGLLAIATSGRKPRRVARAQLLTLAATYILMPLVLAIPLYESIGNTRFLNAYFEMVSALTTTGASVFDNPGRLSSAEHLWRALVGWMGGFFFWVAAIAILAPMNLGGFEVRTGAPMGQPAAGFERGRRSGEDPNGRILTHAARLLPVYVLLTGALWVALVIAGEPALVAVSHAMSTLATSGISPVGGTVEGASGFAGEGLIVIFLIFAFSRRTFTRQPRREWQRTLRSDPELRFGLLLALLVPVLLFLRHWLSSLDVTQGSDPQTALVALWGSLFTVVSFMSTTGFESHWWLATQQWSGLDTPGLILIGLALVGGGVATTAGGVKLLRVYALYKHGQRELGRLVHPSMVAGAGGEARRIRREGAYIAWIFFMLFALSVAVVMSALSLTGVQFETAMVLTVSALSTTGPLADVAGETPISYAGIPDPAKIIVAAAMILGRLETLVVIALFNPEFWRS